MNRWCNFVENIRCHKSVQFWIKPTSSWRWIHCVKFTRYHACTNPWWLSCWCWWQHWNVWCHLYPPTSGWVVRSCDQSASSYPSSVILELIFWVSPAQRNGPHCSWSTYWIMRVSLLSWPSIYVAEECNDYMEARRIVYKDFDASGSPYTSQSASWGTQHSSICLSVTSPTKMEQNFSQALTWRWAKNLISILYQFGRLVVGRI